eukprot:SAG11_NODE_19074_length_474_cov_9.237333_1_plen_32_part_01
MVSNVKHETLGGHDNRLAISAQNGWRQAEKPH